MSDKKRIMVVEDEPITAEDIQTILEQLEYNVVSVVNSGEDAINSALRKRPDIVLMDVMLEGNIDGIEAATKIKKDLDIPIIYITAYADNETLQRAIITEPYGYIVKPFKKQELGSAIEIALYKYKKEKELKEKLKSAEDNENSKSIEKELTKRQKEIISKSMDIIAKSGIQKLTIKSIADEIKVSLPAIYKHFTSKSEILIGIIKILERDFYKNFSEIENSNNDSLEKLKDLFFLWISEFSNNTSLISVLFSDEILRGEQNLNENVNKILNKNKNLFIKFIQECQGESKIKSSLDPEMVATMMIGSLKDLSYDWNNAEIKFSLKKESQKLWDNLLDVLKG